MTQAGMRPSGTEGADDGRDLAAGRARWAGRPVRP